MLSFLSFTNKKVNDLLKKIKIGYYNNSFYIFILIVAAIIVASLPASIMGFVKVADISNFYGIIEGMKANIFKIHQLPYRINMVFLYGVPIPIFYHCTFFYSFFIFYSLLKLNDVMSFNCMIILINILTGINMYLTTKTIYNDKKSALISTLSYLLIVYRLSDIYSRGAMGESIAFCFIPLLVLSVYKIFYGNEKKYINKYTLLFIFSSSMILQDHLLTTYLYFIIISIFLIVYIVRHGIDKKIKMFIVGAILSLLFNAWYLFPIIYNILFVDYVNPAFYQGNSQFSLPTKIESLFEFFPGTFGIGFVVLIVLLIVSIIYYLLNKKNNNKIKNIFIVFSLTAIFVFLLSFEFVSFDLIRSSFLKTFVDVLQFRTRLYLIVFPLICIAGPYLILNFFESIINNISIKKIVYLSLITLIFISPIIYVNKFINSSNFSIFPIKQWNLDYTLTGTKPDSSFEYDFTLKSSDESIELSNINISPSNVYVDYLVNGDYKNKFIEFPLFNYPVYKIYDENNNILKSFNGNNNLIRVYLYNNKGSVNIIYDEPTFWKIGNILSIITCLFIIFKIIIKKKI